VLTISSLHPDPTAFAQERVAALSGWVVGPRVADGDATWSDFVLCASGIRLGGGTDEIQRNVVAERVLGREARHESRPGQ
jgi:alkylation response protein AidB-like acyl-CoA dehydrogenase